MYDSLVTLWTVDLQVSLSMGFFRQEYWSGLPFHSPGDLPNPGIKPTFPKLAGRFFTTKPPGKPHFTCLFNLYAEYIKRDAGLDESQAGIKIAGRNINNPRYTDDTTLTAESEEELKYLLIQVKKESEKAGLKLNIQKAKVIASGPITSWQVEWGKLETVIDFILLCSKITVNSNCSHEIKRHLLLEGKG